MADITPPGLAGFLLRLPAGAAVGLARGAARSRLKAAGTPYELEPLFTTGPRAGAAGLAGAGFEWHLATPSVAADPARAWESAHALNEASSAVAGTPVLVEPDFVQEWLYENPLARDPGALSAAADACTFNDQRLELPRIDNLFAWHLDPAFSQLRQARAEAPGGVSRVRIAHIDTGYDPAHQTLPSRIRLDLQRNFVDDQGPNDARDPAARGAFENPGHGTGTLGILAGGRFTFNRHGYAFDDVVGGAPDAEVVPVRVGRSVLQLRTSTVARGITYAADLCADEAARIHVLSMSMGGIASASWADAVNLAYDAGIVLVAAAGNNFSAGFFGFPTHFIVYPARFRRVIAACGVMANRKPYYGLPFRTMQGNWGPASKMATAVSAFTPNMPWAEIGCAGLMDMDGAGTSSATPQVAAAAALYFQKHAATLFDPAAYPEPWMRVEAVRQALFSRADKTADGGSTEKLGNGILRAADALGLQPPASASLHKTAADRAVLPILRVITGLGAAPSPAVDAMLALEATQLAHRWSRDDRPNPIETALPDPDLPPEAIPPAQLRRFLDAVLEHPDASAPLKARAGEARHALFGTPLPGRSAPRRRKKGAEGIDTGSAPQPEPLRAPVATPMPFVPTEPAFRHLRGYSIDPGLTTQLDLAPIGEVTFKVPWEGLAPGPVGEYLEVIDVDPASGCFYEPVNLDDPKLLAQDGLAPSEGTPQFHQQMVYAVASLTIRNFERALGRRSLWRPGPPPPGSDPKNDSTFVQRLRVYPHALREQNAYYSPSKVALLFGYFKAPEREEAEHVPGGLVFTCLSHDIIAHETVHALLDGMHRRFLSPTNPDVRAFHEAFADIVALLQHFTFPEIVRHQIASTRGGLRSHQNLLGQLAGQFGRSTGRRGALRDAIGRINPAGGEWEPHRPDPSEYRTLLEPHDRGAILVAAVFDAFLAIYERRTADLLRVATGGTGVLQPGAIHPDLVTRLADDAAKVAQHVLTMCIRALDYCPPVDITFGEYLRAIITADTDAVADDDLRYRTAFVEAFRKRGLYPRDLRTLSEDSLVWRGPHNEDVRPSQALQDGLERVRNFAQSFLFAQGGGEGAEPREQVFHLQRGMRRDLHEWLANHFDTHADGARDAAFLGIDPRFGFEVHTARFALRPSPDGYIDPQFLVGLLQEHRIPLDPERPGAETTTFEGGSTIVADLRRLRIRYCIRKNVTSATRQARQQAFMASRLESTRATYLGRGILDDAEPFAALHRGV
ncbi:MAG: S8 family serine peptidase [Vicinamibacterales bacterium]